MLLFQENYIPLHPIKKSFDEKSHTVFAVDRSFAAHRCSATLFRV